VAGVDRDDLTAAARLFAASKNAGVSCGTGPSFGTHGTLTEYLGLCLASLCGRWRREGEPASAPNIMLPAYAAKAQPFPPYEVRGQGELLRVRGLGACPSGLPTAALAEEILLEGKGQVRALICLGGNPMMSWPDQLKTFRALKSLDLLVTLSHEMSATARLADFVIAPKLSLETPATTWLAEASKYAGTHRALDRPWAQYSKAIVAPPQAADVIEEWEFFYGLAQRQKLNLEVTVSYGVGPHAEHAPTTFPLHMQAKPSTDDLLELIHAHSRVPLAEIKRYDSGHVYDELREVVQPRDPGNESRMDVGNGAMMAELRSLMQEYSIGITDDYPLLLVSRRINNLMNSAGRNIAALNRVPHNPLCMHPQDIRDYGLEAARVVQIRSAFGEILGIVQADETLRPGVVSMTHGFGDNPDELHDLLAVGSNVGRLLITEQDFDPITGIPRMSGIPVSVTPRKEEVEPAPADAN
jgi:anaerobic selenocysteine-containing dehydrogenase